VILERPASDVLHRDEHAAVDDPHVVHGHDVRVRQTSHRLRLAEQARLHLGGHVPLRERGSQDLDRDLAIELRIERGVHHAHRPLAEHVEQDVPSHHGGGRGQGVRVRRALGHGVRGKAGAQSGCGSSE
jgi:hypothetical protein